MLWHVVFSHRHGCKSLLGGKLNLGLQSILLRETPRPNTSVLLTRIRRLRPLRVADIVNCHNFRQARVVEEIAKQIPLAEHLPGTKVSIRLCKALLTLRRDAVVAQDLV